MVHQPTEQTPTQPMSMDIQNPMVPMSRDITEARETPQIMITGQPLVIPTYTPALLVAVLKTTQQAHITMGADRLSTLDHAVVNTT